jgi:hypothetical protein
MMIATAAISWSENPFHDYWWRFEAEPFKLGRAISSLFGRISHKKGLLIMILKYSAFEGHMGVTLVSAAHVQRLACEVFGAFALNEHSKRNQRLGRMGWSVSFSSSALRLCCWNGCRHCFGWHDRQVYHRSCTGRGYREGLQPLPSGLAL